LKTKLVTSTAHQDMVLYIYISTAAHPQYRILYVKLCGKIKYVTYL